MEPIARLRPAPPLVTIMAAAGLLAPLGVPLTLNAELEPLESVKPLVRLSVAPLKPATVPPL